MPVKRSPTKIRMLATVLELPMIGPGSMSPIINHVFFVCLFFYVRDNHTKPKKQKKNKKTHTHIYTQKKTKETNQIQLC